MNWKPQDIKKWLNEQLEVTDSIILNISQSYKQQLTHQNIFGKFIMILLPAVPKALQHFSKVKSIDISLLAFPKFINQYLQQYPHLTVEQGKITI